MMTRQRLARSTILGGMIMIPTLTSAIAAKSVRAAEVSGETRTTPAAAPAGM